LPDIRKKEMTEYSVITGRTAKSRMGRDKGKFFMICAVIDADFVSVTDGEYRPLAKPKKKRIKHLKLLPDVLTVISEKLAAGTRVFDSEVRAALKRVAGTDGQGADAAAKTVAAKTETPKRRTAKAADAKTGGKTDKIAKAETPKTDNKTGKGAKAETNGKTDKVAKAETPKKRTVKK
jgi:ribosomal protein L14E/L6E/L27E